ncbi:Pycsar system effector family protein [Corynebacterium glyciniphilum]|uniref:Pycsar system effector family protein n=1 Tax=Corynebacterium glyciniphilum TaxID=1404244 RepID=UPI0011AB3140|nr:Pycsar system effector family protein [Corynebacterium glyciniphilum]
MVSSWRRRRTQHLVAPADGDLPGPNPDHAWKTLSLVNEWIRHSDAKAGVTLAFVGVMGTLTFNLLKDVSRWSCLTIIPAAVACVLLAVTVGMCAWTLTPRVKDKSSDAEARGLLFFAHISQGFAEDRRGYRSELAALSSDPVRLTEQIADQVHANALVATLKTKFAMWAILAAVASGVAVAVLALIINITET